MTDRIFIEEGVADIDRSLPARPASTSRAPRKRSDQWAHLLPYGTTVASSWTDTWILNVSEVERQLGYAICGAKRTKLQIEALVRSGKIEENDTYENPLVLVCTNLAGANTEHPGEGRCHQHGGNSSSLSKHALISHSGISRQVREFFENEDLLDLRAAISVLWVAANTIIGDEDKELSIDQAKELGSLMTRIGNLTKQYNEMVEKRKLSIGVPEFIAWAEHLYELAVKYILDGDKNVDGFLQEAQSYYNATVTFHLGAAGNSDRASQPVSGDPASEVLRSGVSES